MLFELDNRHLTDLRIHIKLSSVEQQLEQSMPPSSVRRCEELLRDAVPLSQIDPVLASHMCVLRGPLEKLTCLRTVLWEANTGEVSTGSPAKLASAKSLWLFG